MVYFERRVVLPADTQSGVDTFLGQIDAFLALLNSSYTTIDNAVSADAIKDIKGTLKSMYTIVDKTLTPGTISAFLDLFKSIATAFERAVVDTTPEHIENTMKRIESTFANLDAITKNIRNYTNVVAVLLGALLLSVTVNIALVVCLKHSSRKIAILKDGSKNVR